jgi:hypothetical protein
LRMNSVRQGRSMFTRSSTVRPSRSRSAILCTRRAGRGRRQLALVVWLRDRQRDDENEEGQESR